MKSLILLAILAPVLGFLAGCSGSPNKPADAGADHRAAEQQRPSSEEAERIASNLGRLAPEDRTLAEAQRFCAVETQNRLGAMGTPVKVMVKDQPVFLCCKGCKETALEEPEKTLAKVQQLKKTSEASGH
jgi:hypothetical protein